ncbi:MAG: glycosyltransferase family 4 protein, partial [Candidatus Latescibacteria bacterium]|nr:glycosyltransferase family 4 protein [Candidatus Latescibacterota bacterium]
FLAKTLNAPLLFAQRSNAIRENIILLKEEGLSIKEKVRALAELVMFSRYENLITHHARAILFQSTYDEKEFLSRNPGAKGNTRVIPGNIGEPRFKKKHRGINHSNSCHKLLFVGNLGYRKGLRYLVDAMNILENRGIRELELDIIGPGDWDEWKNSFIKENTAHNIRFHGRISDPFMFLETSDLLVVPSIFDSFPDTVLEALHTGTAVIGTRAGGIPDMLLHDELLFPVQNAMAIADIIEKCTTSSEYFQKLKSLCTSRASAFFFDWTQHWIDAASSL